LRNYDIVSNKPMPGAHPVPDAETTHRIALEDSARKYWSPRRSQVDPLTGTFGHPAQEAAAASAEAETMAQHAQRAADKVPTSNASSDGAAYDLVGHRVRDAGRLSAIQRREGRGLVVRTGSGVEAEMGARGEAERQMQEGRALARVAPARFTEETQRGYDIINAQTLPDDHVLRAKVTLGRGGVRRAGAVWAAMTAPGGDADAVAAGAGRQ
jgi:hypothetical protein